LEHWANLQIRSHGDEIKLKITVNKWIVTTILVALSHVALACVSVASDHELAQTSEDICSYVENVQIPLNDLPKPEDAESLQNCDPYKLYYGIGQSADPENARLCVYHAWENSNKASIFSNEDESSVFSNEDILIMIYTNGVGAKRNLPFAIKLACNYFWAPAERENRVIHLNELMKQDWQGTDFSICDDHTSSYMSGECSGHRANLGAEKRKEEHNEIVSTWLESEKARYQESYLTLRNAASKYFDKRSSLEIDGTGTLRATLSIAEEEALKESDLKLLQLINAGDLEVSSREAYEVADRNLNVVYQEIQKNEDTEYWYWHGTVTKEGVKETQREWIHYRDSWVSFCQSVYPAIGANSIKTVLTRTRAEMLRDF
jgi:uncharacterized protein YecT (DUF1311 family)